MSGTVVLAGAAIGRLTEVATVDRFTETVEREVSASWIQQQLADLRILLQ